MILMFAFDVHFKIDDQVDTFTVKAIELDELQKIKIRHDNKGGGSAWYLEKVEIFNPNTQRT
jgi:hypothetical protein